MRITTVLFYKPDHKKSGIEIRYYPTIEAAELVADHMVEQFRYWGGGSVPVNVTQTKWTKRGCRTLYSNDFDPADYMKYARENGNLYGYYQQTHHVA